MGKGQHLGEFEIVVLSALESLDGDAYGLMIRDLLEARTERPASIGAIYATLRRLERKGLVDSYLGEPTAERGGRAKRFFCMRPEGAEALDRARTLFTRLWTAGRAG